MVKLIRVTAEPAGKSHEKITALFSDGSAVVLRQRAALVRDYQWAAQHSADPADCVSTDGAGQVKLHRRRDLAKPWEARPGKPADEIVALVQIVRAPAPEAG